MAELSTLARPYARAAFEYARDKGQLDAWFVRYVDPARDGAREPVTGKGQVGLAGPAGKGEPVFLDDWRYLRTGSQTP